MSLSKLESWYASQCNGEWEHGYGVKIDTLDNPGWSLKIDLRGTKKQNSALDRITIERTETDWLQYWTEKKQFHLRCGTLNLSEAVDIFVKWFDSKPQ